MLLVPVVAALVGAILPYTGLAHLLGFKPLPWDFFLILFAMVVVYLALVEFAKTLFYRSARITRIEAVTTHGERLERRILRRSSNFIHRPAAAARRTRPVKRAG